VTFSRVILYLATLLNGVFSSKGLSALLSSLGVLWTFLKLADYFQLALKANLQKLWWLFLVAGGLGAIWKCRPVLRVSKKLKDRDISIEIAIGDIFSFEGAIIVGSNSTFDTQISRELIAGNSIQGQFTKKYYGDHIPLDAELNSALAGVPSETLTGRRTKLQRYPLGTVAKLSPKGKTAYFLSITHINEHGVASGASFEDLKQALAKLWVFIGEQGLKEPLVMPVLGSGFARLTQPRSVIIQEIVNSFIAACHEKTFCDKLIIVLAANDVLKHEVGFNALSEYLHHVCTYTEFASNNEARIGTAAGL
jgi:hypothetical protein